MKLLSNQKKIKSFSYKFIFLFLGLNIVLFTSCVDEDKQLGLSLVQSGSGMDVLHNNGTEVSVNAKCYHNGDSLLTSSYDNFVFGQYKDNYFGKIQSTIYTGLSLSQSQCDFNSLGQIDSVVLCLAFNGAFTKDSTVKTMNMQIEVYPLTEKIDSTKKYSSDYVNYSPNAIFNQLVKVDPSAGVHIEGIETQLRPHLRLKLSQDFVNLLANKNYHSNEEFQEDFKGLMIRATCSDPYGMLAYINMKSDLSGIKVYYHNNNMSNDYAINFPTAKGKLMHLDYDYTGTNLSSIREDTIQTNDYMYVACLGVSETKLELSGLLDWYNIDSIKGAAINRAELILPVASELMDESLYPKALICYRKEGDKYYLLSDEVSANSSSSNWLGNKYDKSIHAYRLDITSYLQNYLKGKYSSCSLYLVPDGRISSANRVILLGPNNANGPKLNIIFSHAGID